METPDGGSRIIVYSAVCIPWAQPRDAKLVLGYACAIFCTADIRRIYVWYHTCHIGITFQNHALLCTYFHIDPIALIRGPHYMYCVGQGPASAAPHHKPRPPGVGPPDGRRRTYTIIIYPHPGIPKGYYPFGGGPGKVSLSNFQFAKLSFRFAKTADQSIGNWLAAPLAEPSGVTSFDVTFP